jgi:hypothetical protein
VRPIGRESAFSSAHSFESGLALGIGSYNTSCLASFNRNLRSTILHKVQVTVSGILGQSISQPAERNVNDQTFGHVSKSLVNGHGLAGAWDLLLPSGGGNRRLLE